jgi:hypothetical protein
MSRTSRWVAAVTIISSLGLGPVSRAAAQDPYHCIDDLTDEEVTFRIGHLEREFQRRKAWSRAWWWTWTGAFAAIIAGQIGFVATADGENAQIRRVSNGIGIAGSTASLALIVAMPFPRAFAPQRIARQPDSTPEERRAKLRYATRLLERAASVESFQSSMTAHLLGAVWGAGWSAFLHLRFRDETWYTPVEPIKTAFASLAVTELKILTLPRLSQRAWDEYRGGACHSMYMPPHVDEDPTYRIEEEEGADVQVSAGLGGFSMRVTF